MLFYNIGEMEKEVTMRLLLIILLCLPAFARAAPLTVVTDIPPVQSLVMQVLGDRGTVSALLEPNSDPHTYQLRPSQSRSLARADLIVWVGAPLSPWMARAMHGIAPNTPSLAFLDTDSDADHQDESHDHGETDPHLWLGLADSRHMIDAIAQALSQRDPDAAAIYAANAAAAQQKLTEVFDTISAQIAPIKQTPFVVGHDAFGHFVRDHQLTQVGHLTDRNDAPASAKTLSKLAQMAEKGDVACVFPVVGESDRLTQILHDRGARLGKALDPVGLTLPRGPDQHAAVWQALSDALVDCLSR